MEPNDGNTGSRSTSASGNNYDVGNTGAIAGGVTVVIIALAAVGVALAFFIFWFL